ncbi:MAG: ATP-binding protein [Desulfobacterales bacterium]|nr:ATP-binding protein [Desulfobacterales bacterium]
MNEKYYNLVGFISPLEKTFGFLMPIFKSEDSYWAQQVESGKISNFHSIKEPDSTDVITCDSVSSYTIGSQAIHAFAFGEYDRIFWGHKEHVAEQLEKRIDELSEYPFHKSEVLKFLGKEKEYIEAIKQTADSKLKPLSPKISKSWEKRVLSEIFVGRENELHQFNKLLLPTCNIHMLSIHTNGEGGIGKTQLLLQMQKICEERSQYLYYTRKLIDFYHTEARTKLDVMRLIAENFGEEIFPNFMVKIEKYKQPEEDRERTRTLIQELENTFFDEYTNFSKNTDKVIVLFFDTYEVIQGTDFSRWLESEFFPKLKQNTRIIVSGRLPLPIIPTKEMELKGFKINDTIKFLKKCFNVYSENELKNQVGSIEVINKIHKLAKGRPILLALFADWCQYEYNPLHPEKIIIEIEEKATSENDPEKFKEQLFEILLIGRILNLKEPQDKAVTYMAFAYRRMTPEMLSFISDISIEKSKNILFEGLKQLSFIKYKEDHQTVLLHDEMRDLIVRHYWDKQDPNNLERKQIANELIRYYDILLEKHGISEMEEAVLYAEKLFYQLYEDIDSGFKSYVKKYDKYLQEYQIYYCDLIGTELLSEQFYPNFSFEQSLERIIRRIRWRNEQYRCKEALYFFHDVENLEHEKKDSFYIEEDRKDILKLFQKIDSKGKITKEERELYANLKHEQGVAYHWLNRHEEAAECFREAEKSFRKLTYQYSLALASNWIGYTQFRSGDFFKSKKTLRYCIEEFLESDPKKEPGYTPIGIENVYSNLNVTFRCMGRFHEAIIFGEMAVAISREEKNDRELIRFLNALGETYKLANKQFEASKCYKDAQNLLEKTPDNLLKARVFTGIALLTYRHYDYIHIFEYYRRGSAQKEILNRFGNAYRPEQEYGRLSEARHILENAIKHKTRELADIYYDIAEHYLITRDWDKAIKHFFMSIDIAKKVNNKYREMDALVRLMSAYYYAGETEFDKADGIEPYMNEIEACKRNIEKLSEQHIYHNLLGRMNITLGGFAYEQYLKLRKDRYLKEAIEHYVIACDQMYAFNPNRFYSTIRILFNRLNELFPDKLPSEDIILDLKDIWHFEKRDLDACLEFGKIFDEIIDFIIWRKEEHSKEETKNYSKEIGTKLEKCIDKGKENLGFAPLYGEMLLQLCKKSDLTSDGTVAEAYRTLGRAYFRNSNVFESHKNYEQALKYARLTNDKLLLLLTLIGSAKTLFRVGEYVKAIEYYLPKEIEDNKSHYNEANKKYLTKADKYFSEAETILDDIFAESASGEQHTLAFALREMPDDNYQNKIILFQTILKCRFAEYLIATGRKDDEIEKNLIVAKEKASKVNNQWWGIKIRLNLLTYYLITGSTEEKSGDIDKICKEMYELNNKRSSPELMGLMEITRGNICYSKITGQPDDNLKDNLRNGFRHYFNAVDYHAKYSDKHFYETVRTILLRIAELPKNAVKLLHEDIVDDLEHAWPSGDPSEKAFKNVVQFIQIRSEMP